MKRLASVLAAAVLGSGCIVVDEHPGCDRSLSVDWSFTTAEGSSTASCGSAGVNTVDVWANGILAGTFSCVNGPGTVAVADGLNAMTIEARDVDGAIRYRDQFTVDASACGHQGTILSHPGEGFVSLGYSFTPTNSCVSPGPSFIWIRVWDDIANELAADSAAFAEQFTCGNPVTFRLAAGDYTLLDTEERVRLGTVPQTYGVVARDCVDHALPTVSTAATASFSVVMADSNVACP